VFLGRGINDGSRGAWFRTASLKLLSLNRCLVQRTLCNLPWKPKPENRGTSAFNDDAGENSVADQSVLLTT
jgi:hypothetical protein